MKELWGKVITYLQDKYNLRKVVIASVAVFLLLGVVLFSSSIQKLFNAPWGIRAEGTGTDLTWTNTDADIPNLSTQRSNAKLIDVVDNDGKRWLYAIGGINQVLDADINRPVWGDNTGNKRINLVKEVERIEINNDTDPNNGEIGRPIGAWEPVASMNFGHAEFGLVVYQDYIAVIAGDIHVPKIGTGSSDEIRARHYPLVYSTIEILNYKDPLATWQVYALISGVNFYPEVALIGDQLHIVGGVYGNPFIGNRLNNPASTGNYNIYPGYYPGGGDLVAKDPIMLEEDLAAWDSLNLASKTVVGVLRVPMTTFRGGIGGDVVDEDSDNPVPIPPEEPLGGWPVGMLPDWLTVDKNSDLGYIFSQSVLNATFYTTVSEHYILDLSKPAIDPSFVVATGQLGMDYTGTLDQVPYVWLMDEVVRFGDLRVHPYIAYTHTTGGSDYVVIFVLPPPQGRYGHKLIVHNGDLLVLGGASWSSTYITSSTTEGECIGDACMPPTYYDRAERAHFWVIDDDFDPFTGAEWGNPAGPDYRYLGNITYMWDVAQQRWDSTNATVAGFPSRKLADTYAFKSPELLGSGKKGRAFFGLGELDFSETVPASNNHLAALAVGGLQNDPNAQCPIDCTIIVPGNDGQSSNVWFNIPVTVTNRTEKLEVDSVGWKDKPEGYINVLGEPLGSYNIFSVGIDKYRSISFDGQLKFQYEDLDQFDDPVHVPDYQRTGPTLSDSTTSMFVGDQWRLMPTDDPGNNGMNLFTFSAVKDVRIVDDNGTTTVYIYKVGGVSGPDTDYRRNWLPIASTDAQYLGPFIYGAPGVPYEPASIFTVDPPVVRADGVSYATATLTLRDYYENPIVGVKAIVDTENNSSWPPNNTDNILIRPLNALQTVPPGWPSPWLLTDSNGQAKFRLTSTKEILLDQVNVYISTNPTPPDPKSECDPFAMPPEPITFTGGASYLNSTIDADPTKVTADGIEYSTVTVTLLDHQDPPMPITTGDYFVKILPDKSWVNVEIINQQINSEGKAIFKVRSATRGRTNIFARYSLSSAGLDNSDEYITLTDTATVEFGAMIASLIPDYGYQGDHLPTVTATGKATNWDSDDTEVEFIPPSKFSFHWSGPNGLNGDIEDLALMANGQITPEIGIWDPGSPSTNVTFEILDRNDSTDPGNFWPDNDSNPGTPNTTYSTNTDSNGKAYFRLRTSRDPGFTVIRTTIGGISSNLWLVVQDPDAFQYELEMLASPVNLATGGQAAVRAAVYKTDGTGRHLVTSVLNFNFLAEATNSTLNPNSSDSIDGIAETQYTRSSENGRFHVFAWTEVDYGLDKLFIASKTIVNHKPPLSDTGRITIGSVTVNSLTELIANSVDIGQTAPLGFWTFRTTTIFPAGPNDSIFGEEVAEYTFKVLPVNWQTGPTIDLIPRSGLRNTNNYQIYITGENTHFDPTSIVKFTPISGGDSTGIEIVANSLNITSALTLEVKINIKNTAEIGFWNVRVTTMNEVAEKPGDQDFAVSDDSGYAIDVTVKPNQIARDGSKAQVEAVVRYVDPFDGHITLIDNVTVYFANDGHGIFNQNSAVTQNGIARVEYTSDVGTESIIVEINASATPAAGVFVSNWCTIALVVNPWLYKLTANPTEIPLYGGTGISDLSISGLPPGQRIPITLHFDNNPKGHLQPAATTSDTQGTAGSTYVAAPEGQRVVEIVRIYAMATVPGYGRMRSNIAEIQIGRDSSKYKIELTAVPDSVIAGGAQRSTVTAVLRFQSQVVADWPINFALFEAAPGDYLTSLAGRTSTAGVLVTEFVPGATEGAVIIKAYPVGLSIFGEDIIAKTADKFPNECLSNISAVSHYVPADGTSYSVITVTLRNSNYVPIAGQLVSISTNNTLYNVRLANGTVGNSAITNVRGQAIFRVSSNNLVGIADVIATFNADFDLETDVIFETPGSLISQNLKLTVPFEMRDYDNLTWIYLTENALTNGYFINEMYAKEVRPNNEIKDLTDIVIYLHPNKTYTMWAKGRYHKAKIKTFVTGSIGQDTISISFDELLIGDLLPGPPADATTSPPKTPFHDNYINTIDSGILFLNWFRDHYLADFNLDTQVNTIDFNMLIRNWGPGAQGAPSPRCNI